MSRSFADQSEVTLHIVAQAASPQKAEIDKWWPIIKAANIKAQQTSRQYSISLVLRHRACKATDGATALQHPDCEFVC